MKLLHKDVPCNGRADVWEIYPLGDLHIGARGCAEKPLQRTIDEIKENPRALWIGGGDYLEAIKPQDSKRYDADVLPDWMLSGGADEIRESLSDVVDKQYARFIAMVGPIRHKCIGLVEGNHEYSIKKYYNQNIMAHACKDLDVPHLTDEAVIRMRFTRDKGVRVLNLYITHGHGGGRTAGAEPNHLHRMLSEWEDCDVCLRGHSHTFDILPPKSVLSLPKAGSIPTELLHRNRWAANWGCWVYSHRSGASTYASRACYPARAMMTCRVAIEPFYHRTVNNKDIGQARIEIRGVAL